MRYRLLLAAIVMIAIGRANPAPSSVRASGPARGQITGTITIRGCDLLPADLLLRAHPADAYLPDDGPPPGAQRGGAGRWIRRRSVPKDRWAQILTSITECPWPLAW